ncbi:glycogen-binding domain-containing protein [bacterium]
MALKKKTGKKKAVKKKAAKKTPQKKKRVTFTLNAPYSRAVAVVGTFNNWDSRKSAMKKDANGTWKKMMYLAPGEYEYKFIVDDNWITDPGCVDAVYNPYGTLNSVLRVG